MIYTSHTRDGSVLIFKVHLLYPSLPYVALLVRLKKKKKHSKSIGHVSLALSWSPLRERIILQNLALFIVPTSTYYMFAEFNWKSCILFGNPSWYPILCLLLLYNPYLCSLTNRGKKKNWTGTITIKPEKIVSFWNKRLVTLFPVVISEPCTLEPWVFVKWTKTWWILRPLFPMHISTLPWFKSTVYFSTSPDSEYFRLCGPHDLCCSCSTFPAR